MRDVEVCRGSGDVEKGDGGGGVLLRSLGSAKVSSKQCGGVILGSLGSAKASSKQLSPVLM